MEVRLLLWDRRTQEEAGSERATPFSDGIEAIDEVRTFGTMTGDLLELADWLKQAGCTHVAMESTGVYWKPVFNILEGEFEVVLVNAHHIKTVPGRKTDVQDCQWIAQLLQHGLLRASSSRRGRFANCVI